MFNYHPFMNKCINSYFVNLVNLLGNSMDFVLKKHRLFQLLGISAVCQWSVYVYIREYSAVTQKSVCAASAFSVFTKKSDVSTLVYFIKSITLLMYKINLFL